MEKEYKICEAVNKSNLLPCKLQVVNGKYCNKHKDYIKTEKYGTNGITITFGNQAENHKGMQIIGSDRDIGYTLEDFEEIIRICNQKKIITELYDLKDGIKDHAEYKNATNAYVLVIKNGVKAILEEYNEEDLYKEHINLKWDSKVYSYGKVKNKKARHNLCFSDVSQEPDYDSGKGRIVSFNEIKLTNAIKERLPEFFGEKAKGLVAEGNLYYNINYNGIGYQPS